MTRDRITTLGKAIADEKKAIDRLVARFELTDDPEVIDSIERRLAERKRLLKGYRDELASAQAALEHIDLSDEQAETLYQLAAGILQRLEAGPSVEQVRAILSALKVQITLDLDAEPNVVKIEWCFGTESTRYIHRNNSGHVVGLSRPGGQLVALHDTPSQLGIQIFHVAP